MGTLALTTFLPSLTMLVPKQHRHDVYKYLFKEGVMVAKKDFNKKSHDDPELDVPNLHVIKLMQSLKSRGYVNERFSWNWYYYYLTNEGIDYLQKFLNLPADVVPATLKKSNRPASRPSGVGSRVERVDTVTVTVDTAVAATVTRPALVETSGLPTLAVEV